jgi:hypothetical protein
MKIKHQEANMNNIILISRKVGNNLFLKLISNMIKATKMIK